MNNNENNNTPNQHNGNKRENDNYFRYEDNQQPDYKREFNSMNYNQGPEQEQQSNKSGSIQNEINLEENPKLPKNTTKTLLIIGGIVFGVFGLLSLATTSLSSLVPEDAYASSPDAYEEHIDK